MPGTVQGATPTTVLPFALFASFSEELRLESVVNEYPDGSSDRAPLAQYPRHFFHLSYSLTPVQWEAFRAFRVNTGPKPFYFYNLRETVPPFHWDPTGASTLGRYTVVFDGSWEEELRIGRSQISFSLREVL